MTEKIETMTEEEIAALRADLNGQYGKYYEDRIRRLLATLDASRSREKALEGALAAICNEYLDDPDADGEELAKDMERIARRALSSGAGEGAK